MPVSQSYSRDVDGWKLETFITFFTWATYLPWASKPTAVTRRKKNAANMTNVSQQHAQMKVQCTRERIVDLVLEDKLFIPDFDIITIAMIHSTYTWCTQLYKFALKYALCLIHLLYCIRANGNDSMLTFYSEGNRRKAELFESPFNGSQNCFALS